MNKTSTDNNGYIIAVTGKGGTGKTVLSALMIKVLAKGRDLKILAIDADSSVSLPHALGIEVKRTVGGIRERVISDPEAKKEVENQHIRDVMRSCLHHGPGFDLLVMGRGEGPGCFCHVNDLLRYGIETLANEYDVVVVDGEAGPEQINRRVVSRIDTLMTVADTSTRAFHTASLIQDIAGNDGALKIGMKGLVVNKVKDGEKELLQKAASMNLEIFGFIPEDDNVTGYDFRGDAIIDIPDVSPCVMATEKIIDKIQLN